MKILIVDDERFILDFTRDSLGMRGYEVVSFADGADVLRYAGLDSVDLALIDLSMPTPGIDVIRGLKEKGCAFPMVVTAGFIDGELEARVRELGAREILRKPFGPRDLISLVERLLPSSSG